MHLVTLDELPSFPLKKKIKGKKCAHREGERSRADLYSFSPLLLILRNHIKYKRKFYNIVFRNSNICDIKTASDKYEVTYLPFLGPTLVVLNSTWHLCMKDLMKPFIGPFCGIKIKELRDVLKVYPFLSSNLPFEFP